MSKNKDLLDLLNWIENGCDFYEEKMLNAKNYLAVSQKYCNENEKEVIDKAKKRVSKYQNKLDAYIEIAKHIKQCIKEDKKNEFCIRTMDVVRTYCICCQLIRR